MGKRRQLPEVFEDAIHHYEELSVYDTHNHLKDYNVLIVSAELDTVAIPELTHLPLAHQLQKGNGTGTIELSTIKTNHSFGGNRIQLSLIVGEWMQKLILTQ